MAMVRLALLVGAVVLAMALSGCTVTSSVKLGRPFDPIAAPVWKAGYTWSYDVTTSFRASGFGEGFGDESFSEADRQRVTLTVFNTSAPVDGEDVYYVRADEPLESNPLFSGSVWAYSQGQLEELANAWIDSVAKPMAVQYDIAYPHAYSPRPEYDPCDGLQPLYRKPLAERSSLFRFPLDDGAAHEGVMNSDGLEFAFKSRLNGLVDVKVPAGTYKAVYITTDFEPDLPAEAEGYGLNIQFRVETWYSPEIRYLAKTYIRAQGSIEGSRTGDGFQFSFNMELRDVVLTEQPEQPAPPIIDGIVSTPAIPSFRIARTDGDPNIANGTFETTFSLKPSKPGYHMDYFGEGMETVGEHAPLDWIDHTTHQVRWLLTKDYEYDSVEESFGDTFTHGFKDGGRWRVEAQIVPLKCGLPSLGSQVAAFATYYEKTFTVNQDAGPGATRSVGTFEVGDGPIEGVLTWTHQPAVGSGYNPGRPSVRSPSGMSLGPSNPSASTHRFYPDDDGTWTLQWIQDGLTLGDDARVKVRIDYGALFH